MAWEHTWTGAAIEALRNERGTSTVYLTMKTYLLAVFCALLAGCAAPTPSSTPLPSPTPPPASSPGPFPSPSPSASTSPSITCVSEDVSLPSGGVMADECPSAIVTFEAVAAWPSSIARIRIDPGPFECGDLWPGVGSPPLCFGPLILPGSTMHGWASFVGTDKVAAIALRRSPIGPYSVGASFSPWQGSLEAFVVPPAGWVMP